MNDLIQIINEISKYGLNPNLNNENKEKDLEKNLIKLYLFSFKIKYEFDDCDYPDFDKNLFPDVIENVRINFPDFGFYHTVLNSEQISNDAENAMGDAVDDLSDIIYDILEIKWRTENNSKADGLWYFELIFNGHTQQHLIDLLNFMKSKNS